MIFKTTINRFQKTLQPETHQSLQKTTSIMVFPHAAQLNTWREEHKRHRKWITPPKKMNCPSFWMCYRPIGKQDAEMAEQSLLAQTAGSISRDLADTFHRLDKNAPLRADILTDIGGSQETQLAALLENMDMFDNMLADYSDGSGSAMEKAKQSAQNLTGSLSTLSNSWTKLVNSMINTDQLKAGTNILNDLVRSATRLVSVLTPAGAFGLGAGLFAGIKNVGGDKMHSPSCFEYADHNMCSLGY